jgi:TRAP-type mannitol/chloroaromatic compound transport system substrate-binding protein
MNVLAVLLERHGVRLRKFDDGILRMFGKVSGEVVAEAGASDSLTRRVYLNARALDFPYGT